MTVPLSAIAAPLLVSTVISALTYWKLDPEQVVRSAPFAYFATPVGMLVLLLVLTVAGLISPALSVLFFVVAVILFGATLRHARQLLPKPRVR